VPLNVSVPVDPKSVPLRVIESPTTPLAALSEVMFGPGLGIVAVESALVSISSSANRFWFPVPLGDATHTPTWRKNRADVVIVTAAEVVQVKEYGVNVVVSAGSPSCP
jgi:hypothetical protein